MSTEASQAQAVLQLREVGLVCSKSGRTVLQDISFELAAGEVLGLMGPSGSGKSSLAMALMGLLPPHLKLEGSIRFQGRELIGAGESNWRAVRGAGMAMVFQSPRMALNPVRSIGSQINAVLRRHRGLNRKQAREKAVQWLTRLGLPEPAFRLREYPHQLSGGACQRVMLAMAMGCRPRVLIADEPTSALDVTTQAHLIDQLRELHRDLGMAGILISHDPGVIAAIGDRTLVLEKGRVLEQANTLELFKKPRHPVTQSLIRSRLQGAP